MFQLKILDPRITVPAYATTGSAAVDLVAAIDEPLCLAPGRSYKVPTGLAVHIEDPDWAGLVLPRSGLGAQGLVLGNSTGLIDSDYTGPLMLSLLNRNPDGMLWVQPLARVAQLVLVHVKTPQWVLVKEFGLTQRGENGFGSTGT